MAGSGAGAVPVGLADGVIEASVAHGVARITLGRAVMEGEAEPVAVLAVPVSRLAVVTRGLAALLGEMERRTKTNHKIQAPNGNSDQNALAQQSSASTTFAPPSTSSTA